MRQAKALVRSWVKVTKSKAGQSKVILKRVVLEQVVRQLNTRLKKNEVEGDWMVYRVQVIFSLCFNKTPAAKMWGHN